MTRPVTGLLIDPVAKAIGPVVVDPSNVAELYLVLGCEVVEFVPLGEDNFLYADEEGLIKDKPGPFFQIDHFAPVSGRAIVFGIDRRSGKTTSPTLRIGDLWGMISFPDIEFTGMRTESDVGSITITPVFKEKGPRP